MTDNRYRIARLAALATAADIARPAMAQETAFSNDLLTGGGAASLALGASIVLVLMGSVVALILTSKRLSGSSLFNRLFIVVATTSAFFSAVSSAVGFALITSQESADFFRNAVLPPAFGVFVFFLGVAIWIGGAELVRHRDWFRGLADGPVATLLHFIERSIKIFIVIPILATILFVVSTWTTVVGIAGVDAVRLIYSQELARLQTECAGVTAYRQKDYLFLEDLRLSVRTTLETARREREGGFQTGSVGRGAVSAYIEGVAEWYAALEESVAGVIEADDPSGANPYDPDICAAKADAMKRLLADNAFANYDAWARRFETSFDDFAIALNRWRTDRRIETLLESQLASFDRANPKPVAGLSRAQAEAIDAYGDGVTSALKGFIRKQKLAKPPEPIPSMTELSPERGLEIFAGWFRTAEKPVEPEKRKSRTATVVYEEEEIAPLSITTPRDAVLKNAQAFSDVWALGVAWDYASYVLMLAFLFFPSAERAAGRKDD